MQQMCSECRAMRMTTAALQNERPTAYLLHRHVDAKRQETHRVSAELQGLPRSLMRDVKSSAVCSTLKDKLLKRPDTLLINLKTHATRLRVTLCHGILSTKVLNRRHGPVKVLCVLILKANSITASALSTVALLPGTSLHMTLVGPI